jgi:hypothetical protein
MQRVVQWVKARFRLELERSWRGRSLIEDAREGTSHLHQLPLVHAALPSDGGVGLRELCGDLLTLVPQWSAGIKAEAALNGVASRPVATRA